MSDSIAINQKIIHLPLLPSRHFPLQREDDSPSTNQRAAQIITHLRPPLFLICTFDKRCLFSALIAGSFHHNLMFVSCRFLGDGCELESYNFSIKEVVMDDEQVEQRWDLTWQVNLVSAIDKFTGPTLRRTRKPDARFRSTACQRGIIRVISV